MDTILCFVILGLYLPPVSSVYGYKLDSSPARFGYQTPGCTLYNQIPTTAELRTLMIHTNTKTAWLNLKRINLERWYWLDNVFYANRISAPEWFKPGMDCAVLRAVDKITDDYYCNHTYNYYMCETTEGNGCPASGSYYKCFTHTEGLYSRTFYIVSDRGNWYNAIEKCYRNGHRLAVIPKEHKTQILQKTATEMVTFSDVWIGLRQKQYQIPNGPMESVIKQYNWGSQVCACPEKDCVIVEQVGNVFTWKQELCSAEHRHICKGSQHVGQTPGVSLKVTPKNSEKTTTTLVNVQQTAENEKANNTGVSGKELKTGEDSEGPSFTLLIIIVIISIVAVIIIVLITVLICIWKHNVDRKPSKDVEKGKKELQVQEEQESLLAESNQISNQDAQSEKELLKADGKKTNDAGNEKEEGCSKQSNPNEDKNRLLPADGMESSDILDAKKENVRECEEESCLNQKQFQEVPNKPPPQGDMTQNVVKVQPLYSESNMDYKGESRDETPSKTDHLENEHDETGKNGVNLGFGLNNSAGQQKIKSKYSLVNGDKEINKSCQSQNILEEKNNSTERRSVFDRLGKQNEEPIHHRESNPRKNKRHSGEQNIVDSDIRDANKMNLRDFDEESRLNQTLSQEVTCKPLPQGDMTQNDANNSKSNSNNDPATHRCPYSDGNMDYKGDSRDKTTSKAEHLENEHDETGKNGVNLGFGLNNPAGQKKIKGKDSQANGDKQTTKSCQSQNIHQEKNNPTERRDRLSTKNEEPAHHRQSEPTKNKRHSGHQNWELKQWDDVVDALCNFLLEHKSDTVDEEVTLLDKFLNQLLPESGSDQGKIVKSTMAIKQKLIKWKYDNKYSDEEAKQKLHELLKNLQWELKQWKDEVDALCNFLWEHKSDKVDGEVTLLDNFLYMLLPDQEFNQGDKVKSREAIKQILINWKSDNKYSDEEAKQKLHELWKDPNVNYCGLHDEIYH